MSCEDDTCLNQLLPTHNTTHNKGDRHAINLPAPPIHPSSPGAICCNTSSKPKARVRTGGAFACLETKGDRMKEPSAGLYEMGDQYVTTRVGFKDYESLSKMASSVLLTRMKEEGMKKFRVFYNPAHDYIVSLKNRETVQIDPDKLKKAIGAAAFNRLTTPVLDEDKISDAIAKGKLDPQIVSNCTGVTTTQYVEARKTNKLPVKDD